MHAIAIDLFFALHIHGISVDHKSNCKSGLLMLIEIWKQNKMNLGYIMFDFDLV